MQVPDHAAALGVGRLDDPGPGRTDRGETRPLNLERPTLLLGLHDRRLVVERHRGPHPPVDLHLDATEPHGRVIDERDPLAAVTSHNGIWPLMTSASCTSAALQRRRGRSDVTPRSDISTE